MLTKAGIGSIAEVSGVDANGMLMFSGSYENESFIPNPSTPSDEPNRVDESDNFDYIWSTTTPYNNLYETTPYEVFVSPTISNNGEMKLQLGANSGQTISIIFPTVTYESLGLADIDIKHLPDYSLQAIDGAIEALSTERSKLGAIQNRIEHAFNNVVSASENLTNAESRIRDADMAKEMINHTKQNILLQVTQSMLAQSNGLSEGILQCLDK